MAGKKRPVDRPEKRPGMAIPWPALGLSAVMGLGCLWISFWWGAAFFLGMPLVLLALDQAVRRGWLMHPDERMAREKGARPRHVVPEPVLAPWSGPVPELDEEGQEQVRAIVAALARAGMFAPQLPDAAYAFPHVADSLEGGADEITVEDVLHALVDPREWFADLDPARWAARFVLHETQVEQLDEYLVQQVFDMARISEGALVVEGVEVVIGGEGRTFPVTMRLTLNGEPQEWRWQGHAKYLSTVLHGHMAAALDALATGRRFAWFYLDQGFVFACLEDGALKQLKDLPSWGHGWVDPDFVSEAGELGAGSTNA